jgi:hypothetical protein
MPNDAPPLADPQPSLLSTLLRVKALLDHLWSGDEVRDPQTRKWITELDHEVHHAIREQVS